MLLRVNVQGMSFSQRLAPLIGRLSFDVEEGKLVSFVGPSGAGKTTLLRMIAGLEYRFQGEVLFEGRAIHGPSRSIQIVFQDSRLLPWKTVAQNVAFVLRNPVEEKHKIDSVLGVLRLLERRDSWPRTLSGGEESRAALARVLACPPRILLLDEPFKSLDILSKFELQEYLLTFLGREKIGAILVSHSVEDAVYMSDVVHCLSSRPMSIAKSYTVDIPRPRRRGDPRMHELSNVIADNLLGLS